MFDKKKIFSILAYAIGFFFWLAIFLLAVIREEPESHHWIFVARNAFEVLPAFVIYLILEFILYPIYKRNRKIARYTLSALMLLLLVSFLWAKIVQAHEPNNDHHRRLIPIIMFIIGYNFSLLVYWFLLFLLRFILFFLFYKKMMNVKK